MGEHAWGWLLFGAVVVALVKYSPFPHWSTYFQLWRAVFEQKSPWKTKFNQMLFLLAGGLKSPIWGFFWLLDEVFFSSYKNQIVRPVFIIGQPRCGTTFLHRTLAVDVSRFYAIRHVEWRYPFISFHKALAFLGLEGLVVRKNYWSSTKSGRLASKMHPNTLNDFEEDGIFFEENFLHHFFLFLRFPYPDVLRVVDDFEGMSDAAKIRFLDVHEKVIKKVSYLRGGTGRLYLSKEVTSHNKLPYILKRYPDARFVVVARPSKYYLSSLLALMRASTQSKTGINPMVVEGWYEGFIARMRSDSHALVHLCESVIPLHLQTRVPALDLLKRPGDIVRSIYSEHKWDASASFCEYLERIDDHQISRDRGYDYPAVEEEGFELYDAFVESMNG